MHIPVALCAAALLSTSVSAASVAKANYEAQLGFSQKFTGFKASRDQPDGIYQVFLRDDGTHSEHIKLADIDKSASTQQPVLSGRDLKNVQPHGGYDHTQAILTDNKTGSIQRRQAESIHGGVTCSYWGALLGSRNIAESTNWLAINCTNGGEEFIIARSSIYAKSEDVVAYVCNYAPNHQHCTEEEVHDAVYGIHNNAKQQEGILDRCKGRAGWYYHFYWWKSYGIDDIANGFCDFGGSNRNGFMDDGKGYIDD